MNFKASFGGLASGADHSFIHEEPLLIDNLVSDIRELRTKMKGELKRGLLIRSEFANQNYSSEFMLSLMREEGKEIFSSRLDILGHIQQVVFFTSNLRF